MGSRLNISESLRPDENLRDGVWIWTPQVDVLTLKGKGTRHVAFNCAVCRVPGFGYASTKSGLLISNYAFLSDIFIHEGLIKKCRMGLFHYSPLSLVNHIL